MVLGPPNYVLSKVTLHKTPIWWSYTKILRLSIFILPKTDSTFIYSSPNSTLETSPKSLHLTNCLAIHTPERLPHQGPLEEGRAQLLAIFAYNITRLPK